MRGKNSFAFCSFLYSDSFLLNLEINALHGINAFLNDRYETKTNYKALSNDVKSLQTLETNRKTNYDKEKRKELIDLEHQGQELCQEHSKVLHQIEHINWHLGHAHPHDIAPPIEHPHMLSKHCHSAAMTGHSHSHIKGLCGAKPSANTDYLQISAERFVKTIAELRRKICQTKQNLEQEVEVSV